MGNFYNWLNETNIGDFPESEIEKDPVNVHSAAYDHAWESNSHVPKAQWFASVNKTAEKFYIKLRELEDAVSRKNNEKYFKKILSDSDIKNKLEIKEFIIFLQNTINKIYFFTQTIPQINSKGGTPYFINNLKADSFGLYSELLDKVNSEENINLIKQFTQPEYIKFILEVIGWINAIAKIFKQARSEILPHQLRNHTSDKVQEIAKKVIKNIHELHDLYYNAQELPSYIRTEIINRIYMYEDAVDLIRQLSKGNFNNLEENINKSISLINNYLNDSGNEHFNYLHNRLREYGMTEDFSIRPKYREFLNNLGDLLIIIERSHGSLKNENAIYEANLFGIQLGRDSTNYQVATDYAFEHGDEEIRQLLKVFKSKADQYIQYLTYLERAKVGLQQNLSIDQRIPDVMQRIYGDEYNFTPNMMKIIEPLIQNLMMISSACTLNEEGNFANTHNFAAIEDLKNFDFNFDAFNKIIDELKTPESTKDALKRIVQWINGTCRTLKNNYKKILNVGTNRTDEQLYDYRRQKKAVEDSFTKIMSLLNRLESIVIRHNNEAPNRDDYEGPHNDLIHDINLLKRKINDTYYDILKVLKHIKTSKNNHLSNYNMLSFLHDYFHSITNSVKRLEYDLNIDNWHPLVMSSESITDDPLVAELESLAKKYLVKFISSTKALMDSINATKQGKFAISGGYNKGFNKGISDYSGHYVDRGNYGIDLERNHPNDW